MMFCNRAVHAKLVGGLGNQLFVYHAGLWLAKIQGLPLKVDYLELGGGSRSHGQMLDHGILNASAYGQINRKISVRRLTYGLANRLLDSKSVSKIVTKLPLRFYTSRVTGFDPDLETAPHAAVLQGYFQSYIYVRELREKFSYNLHFDPVQPSSWFIEMKARFQCSKFAVVHVRRGDYMAAKDTFGILGEGYYKSAWESIMAVDSGIEPIVFSDDVEEARLLLQNVLPTTTEFATPPAGTPDSEILALMSHADSIVIANSTFSWWAAMLNEEKRLIVAPSQWFLSNEDPSFLIPPEWLRVESEWVI